jgi:hypothetical protein
MISSDGHSIVSFYIQIDKGHAGTRRRPYRHRGIYEKYLVRFSGDSLCDEDCPKRSPPIWYFGLASERMLMHSIAILSIGECDSTVMEKP